MLFIISCDKTSEVDQIEPYPIAENIASKEIGPADSDAVITMDNYREFIRVPEQKVKILSTTPEEMNEFFVKCGLPAPNGEEDIKEYYARQREISTRGQFPDHCHLANLMAEMGDLNNDGFLSTIDIVIARWISIAYPNGYETCQGTTPQSIGEFKVGMMDFIDPFYHQGSDQFRLEFNDGEAMRRAILGIICCD